MFNLQHPDYNVLSQDWDKFRLCYVGGRQFINAYLSKFSAAETEEDFKLRLERAYCPAYAKSGVIETKNTIVQRLSNVVRTGGSENYKLSCYRNVDKKLNSMTTFMGEYILPELLVMGRVAIFVDSKKLENNLATEAAEPYLYFYRCEDIINWGYDAENNLQAVSLREWYTEIDKETGLVINRKTRNRNVYRKDGKIHVKTEDSEEILDLKNFPVIILELSESLLTDVADHQIALLNLASSDINFCLKANVPFYIEPYNVMADVAQRNINQEGVDKISIGSGKGRRFPDTGKPPSFINPSPEPLMASMEKQRQIIQEIRHLMSLTINKLTPVRASAASKASDKENEANGFMVIGLELERAERLIAEVWAEYENTEPADIKYPTDYLLRDPENHLSQAKQYFDLMPKLPSITYQREVAKLGIKSLLAGETDSTRLTNIVEEIERAESLNSDPQVITSDIKNGLVGNALASKLRGYPEGQVEIAKTDQAERLFLIQQYQSNSAQDPTQPTGRPENGSDSSES
jgi:hypothetical protein